MKKIVCMFSLLLTITSFNSIQPSTKQLFDEYSVDQIYQKVDLESGTLDEDGDDIDFVFKENFSLKPGKYEIEISDGPGDLYEINGTNIYLKFIGYYGYANRDEGLLIINAYGMGKFILYDN